MDNDTNIGKTFKNRYGAEYTVTDVRPGIRKYSKQYEVTFTKTGTKKWLDLTSIRSGLPKDPMHPTLLGIGVIGADNIWGQNKRAYNIWSSLLSRCYNKEHKAYPQYGAKGVFISPRWLVFSNFVEDLPKLKGYDPVLFETGALTLDKDTLQLDRYVKEYSPKTCILLSKSENSKVPSVAKAARAYDYIVTKPCGTEEHITGGLYKYAKEHGLNQAHCASVVTGKRPHHKGYKFRRAES